MTKKRGQDKSKKELVTILIVVIIAISLAFLFYTATKTTPNALAKVNNVKLTQQDLNEIALTIPPRIRENVTQSDLLEQAINYEIIRQEAEQIGLIITDEEVEKSIEDSLQGSGLTRDDLKESIAKQNIPYTSLFNAYKKQLLSYKYLNATVMSSIEVTEEEMQVFYAQYQLEVPYEEIKQDIKETIIVTKSQQVLGDFLTQKRGEYEIERYQ